MCLVLAFAPYVLCYSSSTALCFKSSMNLKRGLINGIHSRSIIPLAVSSSAFYEALIVNGMLGSVLASSNQKFLTRDGLISAAALGVGLWSLLGWQGWALCVCYLVLGTLVTKVRMREKEVINCTC
jgi:hypothetical protein